MDRRKILIIDDDPDLVEGMRISLEANGYAVDAAENGNVGLEKIKKGHPDLIILDVMMETITEGIQVSQKIRSRAPDSEYAEFSDIPILMLTGISKKVDMTFSPDKDQDYLPVDLFLEKPVRMETLVKKVGKMLG